MRRARKPFLGIQRFHGHIHIVVDLGKFGDPYHIEDFHKMVGKAGNADELISFFGFCEDLYEHGDTAAVDVSFPVEIQQNFLGLLFVGLRVGIVEKGFGKGGNISFDFKEGDGSMPLERYFVGLLHNWPCFIPSFLPPFGPHDPCASFD